VRVMQRRQGQQRSPQGHLPISQPSVEDHGRAVSANQEAAAWYRQAQRAPDRDEATRALRGAVAADSGFDLAVTDLDALTGTAGHAPRRQQMNWERHHIEVIRSATSGEAKRATDLLREHLASVGCDPLALRILVSLRQPLGRDDGLQDLEAQLPSCHPSPWSFSL
jgi:hypothetical protein